VSAGAVETDAQLGQRGQQHSVVVAFDGVEWLHPGQLSPPADKLLDNGVQVEEQEGIRLALETFVNR